MADSPEPKPPIDNGAQNGERPLEGLSCLVLDDEFLIALDIQNILEIAGAGPVTCVATSEAALAALQSEPPFAVAILDMWLSSGQQTSIAVVQALVRSRTPFVLLTGMPDDDGFTKQFPAAPVVEKPYEAALLIAAIQRALRSP
jgi:CheY-like chemotaxis protein